MIHKKQLSEFLANKLPGELVAGTICNLLVEFQKCENDEDYKEEEDRHMTWKEYEKLRDRIIQENKKEVLSFKENMIKEIEDLEIGLSMGGYLLAQNEVPKEIRAEVIRKRRENGN